MFGHSREGVPPCKSSMMQGMSFQDLPQRNCLHCQRPAGAPPRDSKLRINLTCNSGKNQWGTYALCRTQWFAVAVRDSFLEKVPGARKLITGGRALQKFAGAGNSQFAEGAGCLGSWWERLGVRRSRGAHRLV
ncbi:unnamed protein product [Effrenium voratum]|nr:unnamed protein product [Effrenium voratum]